MPGETIVIVEDNPLNLKLTRRLPSPLRAEVS